MKKIIDYCRKSGYRIPGAFYAECLLRIASDVCDGLPFPLLACDACGNEITLSREMTLLPAGYLTRSNCAGEQCFFHRKKLQAGKVPLFWVDNGIYQNLDKFIMESNHLGSILIPLKQEDISIMLETEYIALAHRFVFLPERNHIGEAIFSFLKVNEIQYVARNEEMNDYMYKMQKSGISIVLAEKYGQNLSLFE